MTPLDPSLDALKRSVVEHVVVRPDAAGALVTFDGRHARGLPEPHASLPRVTLHLAHGLTPEMTFDARPDRLRVLGLAFDGHITSGWVEVPWKAVYVVLSSEMTATWVPPGAPAVPVSAERPMLKLV